MRCSGGWPQPNVAAGAGCATCPRSVHPPPCLSFCCVSAADAAHVRLPPVLHTGLDGCGSTLMVLVGEGLADNNSFVSPFVSSFTKMYEPQAILLTSEEGTVTPPTDAEAAAAAASGDLDTAWLGCIVAANAVMAGTFVQVGGGWGRTVGEGDSAYRARLRCATTGALPCEAFRPAKGRARPVCR